MTHNNGAYDQAGERIGDPFVCAECEQPVNWIVKQTGVCWPCQSKKPCCSHCGIIERVCNLCERVGFHNYTPVVTMDGTPNGYACDNAEACDRRSRRWARAEVANA